MGILNDRRLAGPRQKAKRSMSVERALDWAFRREFAKLVHPDDIGPEGYRPDVSTIWVMIKRGDLGCKIEGGGSSDPHEDAEVIAAIVANLPVALGGFRMATEIAEMARGGTTPDWMPGANQRCVPVAWHKANQHGPRARTEVWETVEYLHRGRRYKREVPYCPVTYTPTVSQIGAARRRYLDWYAALLEIRHQLQVCGMLKTIEVTDAMPPMTPWKGREG